jgi:two-component system OmpR family sensor kinase
MSRRSLLRRLPLRTRLIASMLALLTFAMLLIGVATSIVARSYLTARVDDELTTWTQSVLALREQYPRLDFKYPLPHSWIVSNRSVSGVSGPDGTVPADLPAGKQPKFFTTINAVDTASGTPYTVKSVDGTVRWRMLEVPYGNEGVLYVGQSLESVDHAIGRLVSVELLVGSAMLLVMGSAGAALVRASMRPLVEIEKTAAAIAGGDLTRRVPEYEPGDEPPRTEVGTLSRALNSMLGRIEEAFAASERSEASARAAAEDARRSEVRARRSEERMRRFAADASHELRTPLTTIRGFAELYRQGAAREPAEAARLIRRIEDEASRMGLLVDDLLLLARLDQERPLEHVPVDLRVVGADAVTAAAVSAPDRPVELELVPGTGSLVVIGDELRLRQVVGNLMTNALTHTPAGTPVTLRLGATGGRAELAVVDHGPGLTPEQRERVFERFYRVDAARVRGNGGTSTGLGLAIVAALVAAHGGEVRVEDTAGGGATFAVQLPVATVTSEDDEDA